MRADLFPLQMLLFTVAGWVNRVLSENRIVRNSHSENELRADRLAP